MTATRMALEDVGWTDQSPNGLDQIDKTPVIPEHMHNGLKWKALIEEKRQEVLAERNEHIPLKSSLRIKPDPNESNRVVHSWHFSVIFHIIFQPFSWFPLFFFTFFFYSYLFIATIDENERVK